MFRTETNPLLMMTDAERSKTFLNGSKKISSKKRSHLLAERLLSKVGQGCSCHKNRVKIMKNFIVGLISDEDAD